MENMQDMYAERIGGRTFGMETEIYKFEKIKRAKRQADIDHPDIPLIDLGVGESDEKADTGIIETLYENAKECKNRGYADNGIPEFKVAEATYLSQMYEVKDINPDTEVLHVVGTKSAYAMIPQAFINPGDITLMAVPGYPIMGTKTKWLGGLVYELPLLQENAFLPDLTSIPEEICKRAKLLYINYPNNPTGAVATREFFEEAIAFAKKNHIIVVHDAAYAGLVFGDVRPLSFLSVPGAKEVGIEVQSLSKSFNMTGWRLGFIAGNAQIIKAIGAVKDNNDCGQFKAIQYAGIYALQHPEITRQNCARYERRHQKLVEVFRSCGFRTETPKATFYEYIPIPTGTKDGERFKNAEQFSDYLIRHVKISTVPWDDAGAYFRISATFVADTIMKEDQVMTELKERLERLERCQFTFE